MRRSLFIGAGLVATMLAGACSASPLLGAGVGRVGQPLPSTRNLHVANARRCDPIDPRHCLLPFPSDFFTVADSNTDTGRRIALNRESMPINNLGVHADPTEWNRNDGFSPGQAISVFIGGIDLARSEINDVTNIGASLRSNAGIVLLDATTGQRVPYWAEVDASVTDPNNAVVYIRPARNYADGHRIVVAIRRPRRSDGSVIEANEVFRAYRDGAMTGDPAIETQRARYENVFNDLARAGVGRDGSLYLAWDFTIASTRNLTARMLHIRDDAFSTFDPAGNGNAPQFTVDLVEDNPDTDVARRVTGTFSVPLYMDNGGVSGSKFVYGPDGLPVRTGTYAAGYICNIPAAAFATPARGSIYGHGLLGSNDEVTAGNVRAMGNEHNMVMCATKWLGLSDEDIGTAIATLSDISNMRSTGDRLQQGMLNALVLARLVKSPRGFVSNVAFQNASGAPVIRTGRVYYDGNSQGGIMGGGLTAVSTDFTRAVLGVSAMNYSTLLQRSVDWATYRAVYDPSYPDVIERGIGLSLLQMLWDRGEANGYANHIATNPLPRTPNHTVLMEIAIGDFQVSDWAALVEARTIGAKLLCPATTAQRFPGIAPLWGVPCAKTSPFHDSGIVLWDSGTPAPPITNIAPSVGIDSHEDPRASSANRDQKSQFFGDDPALGGGSNGLVRGAVVDVCNAQPCTAPSVG